MDTADVYWTNTNGGAVMKVAISGGEPTELVYGLSGPNRIALDDTSVYWTNLDGRIMKIAK